MFSSRRGKGKSSPSPYNNWEGPVPYYYQSVSAAAASCMKKFRIGAAAKLVRVLYVWQPLYDRRQLVERSAV